MDSEKKANNFQAESKMKGIKHIEMALSKFKK